MKEIIEIVSTKTFKSTFFLVALLALILLAFSAGIGVGLHKARYSYRWGENYERNFISQRPPMMPPHGGEGPGDMMGFGGGDGRQMRNANGLAGMVVSVTDNLIVIKDKDNNENMVNVTEKTIIKAGKNDIKIGDLRVDEKLVIIGKPGDDGKVNADLIRVFEK
ncbi:MAG: hypothetical protein HGA61_01435 [Candidatus Moranbacteria bacterium]|nr:hypothetical protein [Candidatus Moranbacteria bacterium]